MTFSVFAVGVSTYVVPNLFGPVVDKILAEKFTYNFEVHKEAVLTAGVLGIYAIKYYQENALINA